MDRKRSVCGAGCLPKAHFPATILVPCRSTSGARTCPRPFKCRWTTFLNSLPNATERHAVLRALAYALVARLDDADALQLAKLIEQQVVEQKTEPANDGLSARAVTSRRRYRHRQRLAGAYVPACSSALGGAPWRLQRSYIADPLFSAADIALFMVALFTRRLHGLGFEELPALGAWFARPVSPAGHGRDR